MQCLIYDKVKPKRKTNRDIIKASAGKAHTVPHTEAHSVYVSAETATLLEQWPARVPQRPRGCESARAVHTRRGAPASEAKLLCIAFSYR